MILFNKFCRSKEFYLYFCTDIPGPVVSSRFWGWFKVTKKSELSLSKTSLTDEDYKEITQVNLSEDDKRDMIDQLFTIVARVV